MSNGFGVLLMDVTEEVAAPATILAVSAAFLFRGRDEKGELFPADEKFAEDFARHGVDWAVSEVCGLDE